VNAETQVYGIFGDPVRHTLSPLLHNAAFQKAGLNAVYLPFEVKEGTLGLAFEGIRSMGVRGVNLTIPHKEAAMDFIDEVPEDVDRCMEAINTVVNRDGQLYGYNTDGPGFLIALKEELHFDAHGKKILVLGAGGAARGAAFALARTGADTIWVHNRTHERAEGLVEVLDTHFPELDLDALASPEELIGENVDLVVNATAAGMKGNEEKPVDLEIFKKMTRVYDLVYSPAETPLLKKAKSLGMPAANGLGMLAAQAALSFELWTGKRDGVRETMMEALKKCRL
jgi:shikimate dehydrogenase